MKHIKFDDFGARVNAGNDSCKAAKLLLEYLVENSDHEGLEVHFSSGIYDFFEDNAAVRNYYVSNHDQETLKRGAIILEQCQKVKLVGNQTRFRIHGTLIPISFVDTQDCGISGISIDYAHPAIHQLEVKDVSPGNGIVCQVSPGTAYRIENNKLFFCDPTCEYAPEWFMVFRPDGRLAYNIADPEFNPEYITELKPEVLKLGLELPGIESGYFFALRQWARPTPGIFLYRADNTTIEDTIIHFANGMGILAQMSENIHLNGVQVKRPNGSNRYFTTQADATHFSGCKGTIISENGFYEAMADDAINVHGTYLRLVGQVDEFTILASYIHEQCWGIEWGRRGDSVQFIKSSTMEYGDIIFTIQEIVAVDKPDFNGAKTFKIRFSKSIGLFPATSEFGIENLSWVPNVVFRNNTVRNNRARGALFSTPLPVVCENNVFDHVHGTAILLCGDCNGWYETGACRDVAIRNNRFINALTADYQFCTAIIDIYPEIPDLAAQQIPFHSNIKITDNIFETFHDLILHAKSVNGLRFSGNRIVKNTNFPPKPGNTPNINLEKVTNFSGDSEK
jgi:hypothetical protein